MKTYRIVFSKQAQKDINELTSKQKKQAERDIRKHHFT